MKSKFDTVRHWLDEEVFESFLIRKYYKILRQRKGKPTSVKYKTSSLRGNDQIPRLKKRANN